MMKRLARFSMGLIRSESSQNWQSRELQVCQASRWQLKNLALFSLGVAENSRQMTIARKIAHHQRVSPQVDVLAATALPIKPEMVISSSFMVAMDTLGTDLPLPRNRTFTLLVDETKIRAPTVAWRNDGRVAFEGSYPAVLALLSRRIAPEGYPAERQVEDDCVGLLAQIKVRSSACRTMTRGLTVRRPRHWHIAPDLCKSVDAWASIICFGVHQRQSKIMTDQGVLLPSMNQAKPGKIWAPVGKSGSVFNQTWPHSGTCTRHMGGHDCVQPSLDFGD